MKEVRINGEDQWVVSPTSYMGFLLGLLPTDPNHLPNFLGHASRITTWMSGWVEMIFSRFVIVFVVFL